MTDLVCVPLGDGECEDRHGPFLECSYQGVTMYNLLGNSIVSGAR